MDPEKTDELDLNEIAGVFRVTEKAVRGWIAAGMPVLEHGTQGGDHKKTMLSLRAAVEWYFAENFERLELERARTRLADEQAKKAATENAETRGELGSMKEIDEWFGGHVERCRARLLELPGSIGQLVEHSASAYVVAQATRLVHEALTELSTYGPKGRAKDSGALASASAADGKRVGRPISKAVKRGKRRTRPVAN